MKMYSGKVNKTDNSNKPAISVTQSGGKWLSMKIDGKTIMVPSPEYVQEIEKRCQRSEKELEMTKDSFRASSRQIAAKLDQAVMKINELEKKLR